MQTRTSKGYDPEGREHEALESPLIEITEPGYVYIYLSNEEPGTEVYFDDFKVTHTKSPVIQSDDYYPFGLAFNSYSRENSTKNNYLYNGKELQDELNLGWMDYGARMYIPEIGRWGVVDPLADRRDFATPYNYVLNNPILRIDPFGLTDYKFNKETGEVEKYQDTDDKTDRIVKTDKNGNVKKKGEGFLGFLVSDKNKGKAKTEIGDISKGILKDGQNFKSEDNVIDVGKEGQPTADAVHDFARKMTSLIGVEISGYDVSSLYEPDVSQVFISDYGSKGEKDNSVNTSTSSYTNSPHRLRPDWFKNGGSIFRAHWHTHPNHGRTGKGVSSSSPADDQFKRINEGRVGRFYIILSDGEEVGY